MTNLRQLVALVSIIGGISSASSASFDYGNKKVRGVNLGGWLILEKWIKPSVFAGLPDNVTDEWTFCQHLGYKEAEKRLKAHWDSFVTENDIIALKKAGINHLRIPFGYWAFEIPKGEPWVRGSWDYAMKAVGWAKKQGLNVMIDLHAVPGSQNGQDHSGHIGNISFYDSESNVALATKVIGKVTQIFNTAEWRDTVTIIQVINEPNLWANYHPRLRVLKDYYLKAYDEVRKYNKDVVVAVHDAFISFDNWYYLGEDSHYSRVMLDTHHYQLFTEEQKQWTCEKQHSFPCETQTKLSESNKKLWTVVGEWSLATPKNCKNQSYFATQQIGVFESKSSGWFMWNFKNDQGWNEWDFLASARLGWINLNQKTIAQKC